MSVERLCGVALRPWLGVTGLVFAATAFVGIHAQTAMARPAVLEPARPGDHAAQGTPGPFFVEEGFQKGLNYLIGSPYEQLGAGLALVDLNNSGRLDAVVLGATNGLVGVYEQLASGQFANRSFTSGIGPMATASGVSAADYDGDGLLDLFIGGWFTTNRLLRNNGNFTFTDVTAQAGLTLSGPSLASAWADFDSDGWLDLYVAMRSGTFQNFTPNKLYRNNGDGTFTEMAAALGVDCGNDPSLLAVFFDYDRDGRDDLYVGTDKGAPGSWRNRLFRNEGGTFTEVTAQANAEAFIECMGFAIGDLNFDGFFDVYMTNNLVGNLLLVNDGQGGFVDQTAASGMGGFDYGWATVFADFDNDTHLDTYVCNQVGPNQLFHGTAAWPMDEIALDAGVALTGRSYSLAVGDVDGDGRLDMLVDHMGNRVKLYLNRTEAAGHHARFKVIGQGANTFAVGAQLDIRTGDTWQARQIHAGSNYKATNEYIVHVGIADTDLIDEVLVRWPATGETRRLTHVPANRQWTIHPPERLGDANGDGLFRRGDAWALFRAMTGPGVPIQPGQEIFDLDGDFDIDADDLALLAARMGPAHPLPRLP
jgi:hypothetical protein